MVQILEELEKVLKEKYYINYKYLNNILQLFDSDYVIFLTGKFFIKNILCFNLKKNLINYLNKYNIVCLNYEYKKEIISIINLINIVIENKELKNDDILLKKIKKIKKIYFSENIIEPDILYKKIQFSNQEIFISFDSYVIKKIEYKLRTFCQIAEKLGALKIIIDYQSSKNEHNNFNISVDLFSSNIGTNIINTKNDNENIQIIFEYPNNNFINLNKFQIINSIINENEFLITKEEFESDVELKFLIDARCMNFIQKYNTNFIMNHINKIEQKIFVKSNEYGLKLGNLSLKNNHIKISISIDFLQIQNNTDIIDGTNIHILREGFVYLASIIKKDNKYDKILRFLYSHLFGIQKKWILLQYEKDYIYDNIDNITKVYDEIINLNFTESEIYTIVEDYFKTNLTWDNFKKFRDIILIGSDTKIEKLYFVSFQYHNIINNKKYIINDIKRYINKNINNFIFNLSNVNIIDTNVQSNTTTKTIDITNINIDVSNIITFIQDNIDDIKNIILLSYEKSFEFNDGLFNNILNKDILNKLINNILIYYYDNKIKNLQLKIPDYNLKKNVFENIIYQTCFDIVNELKICDSSPTTTLLNNSPDNKDENLINKNKISLYQKIQKIFLKFIIKYFDFENKINLIIKKLNLINTINNKNIETEDIVDFLNKKIPINKCYKNYNKYKLFYTWEDFQTLKNYFLE